MKTFQGSLCTMPRSQTFHRWEALTRLSKEQQAWPPHSPPAKLLMVARSIWEYPCRPRAGETSRGGPPKQRKLYVKSLVILGISPGPTKAARVQGASSATRETMRQKLDQNGHHLTFHTSHDPFHSGECRSPQQGARSRPQLFRTQALQATVSCPIGDPR